MRGEGGFPHSARAGPGDLVAQHSLREGSPQAAPSASAENLCSPNWGVAAGHLPNRTGTAASLGPLAEHTVLTTRMASPWPWDVIFPHQRTEDRSSYARRPGA